MDFNKQLYWPEWPLPEGDGGPVIEHPQEDGTTLIVGPGARRMRREVDGTLTLLEED